MPAARAAVSVVIDLEAAVANLGVRGIGEYLAVFLGIPRHGDEERRKQPRLDELALLFFEHVEDLFIALSEWNDHLAPLFQLVDERLRNFFRRTGDNNLVERGVFG